MVVVVNMHSIEVGCRPTLMSWKGEAGEQLIADLFCSGSLSAGQQEAESSQTEAEGST